MTDDASLRRWVADAAAHRFDARVLVAELTPNGHELVQRSLELEHALADELADLGPELTGDDVMQVLGLDPGPQVGQAIAHLQEIRFTRGPMTRDEAIAALQEWHEST